MFWLLFAPLRWLRRLVVLAVVGVVVLVVVGVVAYQHTAGSGTHLALPTAGPGALFGSPGTHTPATTASVAARVVPVGRMPGGDRANGVLLPAGPAAHHVGVAEPDRALTPGATDPRVTQADIASTICRAGYTKTVRPPVAYTGAVKRRLMAQAHATGAAGQWEGGHLVPLEIGGDPGYTLEAAGLPANLWLEPWNGTGGAHAKDVVENTLHRAVCNHQVSLHAAQMAIGADWYTALHGLHLTAVTGS